MQEYKLEGVMFTASPDATEDELNELIPLSHCALAQTRHRLPGSGRPRKGLSGRPSQVRHVRLLNTSEACVGERGDFHPICSTG